MHRTLTSTSSARPQRDRLPSGSRPGLIGALARWMPLLGLVLVTACGVTRAPIDARSDPAALPNLRRASQALQERIVREKEHVTDLNRQLTELMAAEERVYAEVYDAEGAYQRLRADADDVQADLAAVEAELDELRWTLELASLDLEAARWELASLEADLVAERQAGLKARREIDFWRGGSTSNDKLSTFRQMRLEEFRKRWGIPTDSWARLLNDFGVPLALDDPDNPAPVEQSEPLPPDSLPPPDGAMSAEDASENSDSAVIDGTTEGDSDSL